MKGEVVSAALKVVLGSFLIVRTEAFSEFGRL